METVEVSANDLYTILTALTGPPHLIRELQATGNLPGSAIDKLIDEFNAANTLFHATKVG